MRLADWLGGWLAGWLAGGRDKSTKCECVSICVCLARSQLDRLVRLQVDQFAKLHWHSTLETRRRQITNREGMNTSREYHDSKKLIN